MAKSKRGRENEGRPSIYTKELGLQICALLATGKSLRSICMDEKMPNTDTIYSWVLDETKKEFSDNYVRARMIQADQKFEEMEQIADESFDDIIGDDKSDSARINARKLQVDTKKWILSKMLPKKYGDKLDLTSGGDKLPQPILNVIPADNSNAEDKDPQ